MNTILCGDALEMLRTLPSNSVQCCVTSPPYYGLRDYQTGTWEGGSVDCNHFKVLLASDKSTLRHDGRSHIDLYENEKKRQTGIPYRDICGKCGAVRVDKQIGLEESPQEYIDKLVQVFREVRRVLRSDGTLWLNIGSSYASKRQESDEMVLRDDLVIEEARYVFAELATLYELQSRLSMRKQDLPAPLHKFFRPREIYKPKDDLAIPHRLYLALMADGWYGRSDIVWFKENAMPESVRTRPTNAHEYVFLLAKNDTYFYDVDAVREPHKSGPSRLGSTWQDRKANGAPLRYGNEHADSQAQHYLGKNPMGRNKRSVWRVNTVAFPGAHFGVMPPKLVEPCVLAGSSPRACEHCGAPWQRVTERFSFGKAESASKYDDNTMKASPLARSRQAYRAMGLEGPPPPKTIGWESTCSCENNTGSGKCIVLDPFAGAGTTLLVASQLSRGWLGVELNPDYIALASRRLATVQPNLWEAS